MRLRNLVIVLFALATSACAATNGTGASAEVDREIRYVQGIGP